MSHTMDNAQAISEELADLVARGNTSAETLSRVVDALASNTCWYEENPYYDGLCAREITVELWRRALDLIGQLGEPAIDVVVQRIAQGDANLLYHAETLGPRIVALAERTLVDGPDQLVPAAMYVLARNMDRLDTNTALVNYLRAFDRHVPTDDIIGDMLVETWPRLATSEGREAVLARWADGSLRPWIEARFDPSPWRVRHLVALLAVVPLVDALPLLRRALADLSLGIVFEPLLVIDVQRAQAVLEADPEVRAWAEPLAMRVSGGGRVWDSIFKQPRDFALVAAFAEDRVYARLIEHLEYEASWGRGEEQAAWRALAAHVVRDRTRFPRAATAAINNQLHAGGPGVPGPRHALHIIGELDPTRMIAHVVTRLAEVKSSNNAFGFIELFEKLGHPDALSHLEQWSHEDPHWSLREDIAKAIASIKGY